MGGCRPEPLTKGRTLVVFSVAASIVLVGLAIPSGAAEPEAAAAVDVELRQLTQQLLDAIAPGEARVWQLLLDDRFVRMDENGALLGKPEVLKELTPLPAGLVGRIEIDKFQATIHGNTAVTAYEMQEYLDYHGQPLRSRFRSLDTWLRTRVGWRLVGQHTAAVLKDPPIVRLPSEDLCAYEGVYSLIPAIQTTVRCEADGLSSARPDRPAVKYVAELRDVFFVAGQPRTRRIFTRDSAGRVDGFVDRREGEDVRWTKSGARPEDRE